ncbi:receptor like protein kinase S.2-like [Rutidosis leptorrhynchoides]|uniref:receptor like protein kinase S.2-like n=1 Tax=Rutidosis leptorrhynchoides TaxID=125765 RepID=UPI003A99DB2B
MESTITKFSHLQIPLEEVLEATNNFDDENVIGSGGLGKVYQGRLLRSVKWVKIAARRFDHKYKHGIEFLSELYALATLEHENIVSIIGFCDEQNEKVIINKREAKGSLEMHLIKLNLTWIQRLKISIGIARALSYIHNEGSLIHLNINSYTILLNNKFEPKLSGFEYSIKHSIHRMDDVHLSKAIGTTGYMDPENVKTGGVTHKSDIYSFGVVLLVLLCARKADMSLVSQAKLNYETKRSVNVVVPFSLYDQIAKRPSLEQLTSQFSHLKIRLDDIILATNNFSQEYHIGGTTYYNIYRAKIEHWDRVNYFSVEENNKSERAKRRTTVFIKRLCPHEEKQGAFFTEIEILTTCKHRNIVTLLGFCDEGLEKILIIDDAYNGHLANHMETCISRSILTWEKRLKICLDVAYGLKYLHYEMENQKTVIKRNFSIFSIVLDENFGAKIVDFEQSVFLPSNQDAHCLGLLRGFPPYIDPEYRESRTLKRESDVYVFGLVLFEVLFGWLAGDQMFIESKVGLADVSRQCFRKGTIMGMVDPIIKRESGDHKDSIDTFVKISYWCLAETQDRRPSMKEVVKELEKALSFQDLGLFEIVPFNHNQRCFLVSRFFSEQIEEPNGSNSSLAATKERGLAEGTFCSELKARAPSLPSLSTLAVSHISPYRI